MHTYTIPSKIVKIFTNYEYSHVGISLSRECDEIYSFGRKKINSILNGGFVVEKKDGEFFKKFNNTNNRKYVTTQSLKKLKSFLKDWSLDLSSGWKLSGSDKIYDISKLREDDELIKRHYNSIFYKERMIL